MQKKKKQQKVHVVHKVFAVLLTVVGFLVAVGPVATLGIVQTVGNQYNRYAISDLSENYPDEGHGINLSPEK